MGLEWKLFVVWWGERFLWENNFFYFDVMLFHKFGDGDIVSARAVSQLPDSQNFISSRRGSCRDGWDVGELTRIFEILISCTDPLD